MPDRAARGANYQVHTPNAVAAVRGTKFDTAYSENVIRPGYQGCEKYTDVSVYQGTVNLAQIGSPNTGEDVRAGYEATVPCDKPPTESGPLSMTGAVSLESANAGGASFAGAAPGSSAAPVPACPVCVNMTTVTSTGTGGEEVRSGEKSNMPNLYYGRLAGGAERDRQLHRRRMRNGLRTPTQDSSRCRRRDSFRRRFSAAASSATNTASCRKACRSSKASLRTSGFSAARPATNCGSARASRVRWRRVAAVSHG